MREILSTDLPNLLNEYQPHTLLISAPSYEPRATLPPSISLLNLEKATWAGHLLVFQIATPSHRVESLEWLTRISAAPLNEINHRKKVRANICHVSYPDNYYSITRELENAVQNLRHPYRIFLDITVLPRRIIALCLKFFQKKARDIEKIFLIYTWAGGYPEVQHPTATGDLVGIRSLEQPSLHELLDRAQKPAVLVFPGRQGFDSQQIADAFRRRGERIRVAALFDGTDPLLSLDVLRANANLLWDSTVDTQYYLTMTQAYKLISDWVLGCVNDDYDALFIAPFGPKPLLAWAWLRLSQIKAAWDILLLNERTLLSTYSIGRGRTLAFELTQADLISNTEILGNSLGEST